MQQLESETRLKLLRLVCAMAWADNSIQQAERGFLAKLTFKMGAPAAEIRQVKKWLAEPPSVEDIDPSEIPQAHRELFVAACRGVMAADGAVTEEEKAELARIEKRLGLG